MSMNDPLADMLTRIRNAAMAKFDHVEMPYSNIKKGVAEILMQEGYIGKIETVKKGKFDVLKINLKYDDHNCGVITGIKRVSTPGRRQYVGYDHIPRVMSGLGIAVLSTSKGIMADKQARDQKVGGEILCHVW